MATFLPQRSHVQKLNECVVALAACQGSPAKEIPVELLSSLSLELQEVRDALIVDQENPTAESGEAASNISQQFQALSMTDRLLAILPSLPQESRKMTATVISCLLRRPKDDFSQHLESNMRSLAFHLAQGHHDASSALVCGGILRDWMQFGNLATQILRLPDLVWPFFDVFAHQSEYELASDAFATIRELLTAPQCDPDLSRQFVAHNVPTVLAKFEVLLQSENYITKRKALKLLHEMLVDRRYQSMMLQYVSSKEHLKTIMNMLKQKSVQIQFESFHIFIIFVANPHKPPDISAVLYNNKDKLVAFLQALQPDRSDPVFHGEKATAIETLMCLPPPAISRTLRKEPSLESVFGRGVATDRAETCHPTETAHPTPTRGPV